MMLIAEKYRPHYTYDQYVEWEGEWELIDGLPYALKPGPGALHQRTISAITYLLFVAMEKNPCNEVTILGRVDWKISNDTVVRPDILITAEPITDKNYLGLIPELIIEIISDLSEVKDRREKFEIYQQQGVKYYLIVDPVIKKIEIFYCKNGLYELVAVNPESFTFDFPGCSATVDFSVVFPK